MAGWINQDFGIVAGTVCLPWQWTLQLFWNTTSIVDRVDFDFTAFHHLSDLTIDSEGKLLCGAYYHLCFCAVVNLYV